MSDTITDIERATREQSVVQQLARPEVQLPGDRDRVRLTGDMLALVTDTEKRDAWIAALVDAEVARQTYQYDRELARQFALCGKFDDIKGGTPDQNIATAIVKIQLGRAWGFNPADSIKYIYFVNGKPALETAVISAKLQQHGYNWDLEWVEDAVQHKGREYAKCVGCKLWVKRLNKATKQYEPLLDREGKQVVVAFTEFDADNAKVTYWDKGKNKLVESTLAEKATYQSWGRDMYFWRAISRVQKYHAPHVLRGSMEREEALETISVDAELPGDVPEIPSFRDQLLQSAAVADDEARERAGE